MNKTQYWAKCRMELKKIYQSRGITTCELKFDDCWRDNNLSFAHRHKRNWYLEQPELIGAFSETILCCVSCHQILEKDPALTEEIFYKLRDTERPITMPKEQKDDKPKKTSKFKRCPKCHKETTLFICDYCKIVIK